jgi:hypothetical protein
MGMPDFGPQQPAGCEGKIDFLFVISAQGTMKDDQERLIASFPGFMDAIRSSSPTSTSTSSSPIPMAAGKSVTAPSAQKTAIPRVCPHTAVLN